MSKKIILIVIAIIVLGGMGYFVYQSRTEESANKAIQKIFVEKYPNYAETLSVNIEKETKNHVRGNVNFIVGAPGGLFLAVKSDDKWQIAYEGNGQIPCSLSSYGFSADMLFDCVTTPEQNWKNYKNEQYGFTLTLTEGWQGYSVTTSSIEYGWKIIIRHPQWTEANPYEDIPILVYLIEQWKKWEENNFEDYPTAAPFGPLERGRNAQYVFATAPRYNYDYRTGWEEAENIIKTLKAF